MHVPKCLQFKCISIYSVFPSKLFNAKQLHIRPCNLPFSIRKMVVLRDALLVLVIAVALSLASTHFTKPMLPFLKNIASISLSHPRDYNSMSSHHHHHRRHHHHHSHNHSKQENNTVNVCEDFPPDFPPPDTNTTSVLCVDRNGCCNFTTVESAVDAAPVLSQKRIIIWINSGVY